MIHGGPIWSLHPQQPGRENGHEHYGGDLPDAPLGWAAGGICTVPSTPFGMFGPQWDIRDGAR